MADPTGTLHVEHDGKTYALRLTMAGIGRAQEAQPDAMNALISGHDAVPSINLCLLLVSLALQKGEKINADEAEELADEIFTADQTVVPRLMAAMAPDVAGGSAPGKPKAKR